MDLNTYLLCYDCENYLLMMLVMYGETAC